MHASQGSFYPQCRVRSRQLSDIWLTLVPGCHIQDRKRKQRAEPHAAHHIRRPVVAEINPAHEHRGKNIRVRGHSPAVLLVLGHLAGRVQEIVPVGADGGELEQLLENPGRAEPALPPLPRRPAAGAAPGGRYGHDLVQRLPSGDRGRERQRDLARGRHLFRITGREITAPTRYSVQVSSTLHLDQACARDEFELVQRYFWRYLDHACEPTARISDRKETRIFASKPSTLKSTSAPILFPIQSC